MHGGCKRWVAAGFIGVRLITRMAHTTSTEGIGPAANSGVVEPSPNTIVRHDSSKCELVNVLLRRQLAARLGDRLPRIG